MKFILRDIIPKLAHLFGPGSGTIQIIMFPVFYRVTFFVNCCGEPLEGMMLTIGSVTVITGADGLAVFNLTEGDYTIEINGYISTVPETTSP